MDEYDLIDYGYDYPEYETDFSSWEFPTIDWNLPDNSMDLSGLADWGADVGLGEGINWDTESTGGLDFSPYELSFEAGATPTDWGNLFSMGSLEPTALSWSGGSPYSWSDIQPTDLSMAADLGYDLASQPNISFYDRASELQTLEDMGVINALQKEDLMGQLREQYDAAYQGYDTPRAFTMGLTGYEDGPGAFYQTGLADTSGSGNLYWDAGRNEWVTEGNDIPNIIITGSGQQDQTPSGLVWNPDRGWVDPKTGDVVYSGANAGEDFTPYGMTMGVEGPDTSWDTANGLGQTAKSLGLTWDPDRGWINVGGQVVTPDQAVTTLEGVEAITDSTGRIVATRDPITGEVTQADGSKGIPDDWLLDKKSGSAATKGAQAAADAILGGSSSQGQKTAAEKYYQDIINQLQKQNEQLVKAATGAAGGTTKPTTSTTQPSKVQGALNIAQSVLRMLEAATGKNVVPTQARSSAVQNIGPQAQGSRAMRTMYAKGGSVELPTQVLGGLLPMTLKVAEHMMNMGRGRHAGLIGGRDGGQDDVVDIKAAPGEYVLDAEIVSAIGDGNTENGARKLDKMRYNIRKHKRSGGLTAIPPKARSPEQYLKGK